MIFPLFSKNAEIALFFVLQRFTCTTASKRSHCSSHHFFSSSISLSCVLEPTHFLFYSYSSFFLPPSSTLTFLSTSSWFSKQETLRPQPMVLYHPETNSPTEPINLHLQTPSPAYTTQNPKPNTTPFLLSSHLSPSHRTPTIIISFTPQSTIPIPNTILCSVDWWS